MNRQGRDSKMGTVVTIRVNGNSKPAGVMLIRGKSELLLRIDIVTKLDIAVRFAAINSRLGRSGGK